jgi:hypothetical protein
MPLYDITSRGCGYQGQVLVYLFGLQTVEHPKQL